MNCALSGRLANQPGALPDEDREEAREGTCAAWVAETVINGDATHCDDMVGKVHSNGWEVTDEMARFLQPYVEMLQGRHDAVAEVYRETANDDVKVSGTLDAESFLPDGTLCIDDLKYGRGVVEPDTWQLKVYLALRVWSGALLPDRVQLGIYQPRAIHHLGTYRTITMTRDECIAVVQQVNDRAVELGNGENTGTPGRQCTHCVGGAICDALVRSVYAMWTPVELRTYTIPSNQQLADELDMLDRMSTLLKARTASVEAEVEIRMNNQQMIPGWAKMPKKGNRTFTIPGEAIKMLTGVDPWMEPKLCTPAELERRGANRDAVGAITTQPIVGHKLTRVDEKQIGALFKSGEIK